MARIEQRYHPHKPDPRLAPEAACGKILDPDPKSRFRSQLGTEVVEVIGMFYPRQNSVLTLYFALGIMGVVGTADIGAFQFRIQPTAKSATASP